MSNQKKFNRPDIRDILSRVGFFDNLSPTSIASLSELCIPKHIIKKEMLFFEGENGVYVYLLVTGSIQVFKEGRDNKDVVIKILNSGEIFGEVILFNEKKYPASAVALKDSFLYLIPKNRFINLLKEDSDFCTDFFKTIMKKLTYLTNIITHLTNHDVEERLFIFLKEQYGDKKIIHQQISKKDVASAINATPETLSRLLKRLKKEDKLTWEKKEIKILV